MEQGEKNFESKNKKEKEINVNEELIGDLLREQSSELKLTEENKKILKLFSEMEEIRAILHMQFMSDRNKKRDIDHHLNIMSFDDLSKSDKKDLNSVVEIFRELLFFANLEKSVHKNEIIEAKNRHELVMGGILNRILGKEEIFAQYLKNAAQSVYYFGDIIKNQQEKE